MPEVPSNFGLTVAAISALALALSSVAPVVRAQRKVKPKLDRARDACVAVMGEARILQAAINEAKAAVAIDITQSDRLAQIARCRRALLAYRNSFEATSLAFDRAIARVEELAPIEPQMLMTRRDWRSEWRGALEGLRALKVEFDAMFRDKAFQGAVAAADEAYAKAVDVEVELALETADVMTRVLPSDANFLLDTLRQMVDFCEEHGIGLPELEDV